MIVKEFSSFILYSCLHPAVELIERRDISKTLDAKKNMASAYIHYTKVYLNDLQNLISWNRILLYKDVSYWFMLQ